MCKGIVISTIFVPMDWFENWFDSPYYHILYQNRDNKEAQSFMDRLIQEIPLNKPGPILDLACGKGRHSRYLHERGFSVVGMDLSAESINYAKQFETEGLEFVQGDMRDFNLPQSFAYVLNLFTSFGYFSEASEDQKIFVQIHQHLHPQGLFIQDYLNAEYAAQRLVPQEEMEIEGIRFFIERKIENGYIYKDIRFEDQGQSFHFTEQVKTYQVSDFERLAEGTHFQIMRLYGDYQLSAFDPVKSPRLIIQYSPI